MIPTNYYQEPTEMPRVWEDDETFSGPKGTKEFQESAKELRRQIMGEVDEE